MNMGYHLSLNPCAGLGPGSKGAVTQELLPAVPRPAYRRGHVPQVGCWQLVRWAVGRVVGVAGEGCNGILPWWACAACGALGPGWRCGRLAVGAGPGAKVGVCLQTVLPKSQFQQVALHPCTRRDGSLKKAVAANPAKYIHQVGGHECERKSQGE